MKNLFILIFFNFFSSCKNSETINLLNKNNSTVDTFEYTNSFGDNVNGIVNLNIFEINHKPICSEFDLMIDNELRKIKTDKDGFVEIFIKNGKHNLKIKKEVYEPLNIINYYSFDDQITQITLILAKGNEEKNYSCPEWKKME